MAALPTVYVIVPPTETRLGGAEKRLIGFWLHTVRRGLAPLRLVVGAKLHELIQTVDEFHDIARYRDQIDVLRAGAERQGLFRLIARVRRREPRALFHLVMMPPGLRVPVPRRRTLFTFADASLSNFSKRGRAVIYASCLYARLVDVLDEDVGDHLRRHLPIRASKVAVTPGSFVDLERLTALPATSKRNQFVFSGAFIPHKQFFRLTERLPGLHERLLAGGVRDPSYVFLGRDANGYPSGMAVIEKLASTLPVRAFYASRPSDVLRESKVFFGVQKLENYPSKALLEAMACGCLPIITDVGKSRHVAEGDFAWFVPGAFEVDDLASAAVEILGLGAEAFDDKVGKARAFLGRRFSVEATTDFYLALYARLNEAPQ